MKIVCLDLEGVLVPEIWIEVSKRFRLESLRLTTRDMPDYDKLMKYRLNILRKEKIRLKDIQKVIAGIQPLAGAKKFLDELRAKSSVMILSDTYYEFAGPLMRKLGQPSLFCNWLETDKAGYISNYILRQKDGKTKAVKALQSLHFKVYASGDSYNDLGMLQAADRGVLFNPPESIVKKFPKIPVTKNYRDLLKKLS
ncbi:MAG: bifunctional phosphoserine phosphatase/homoserine phosphotransferase ThrH [Candidatus Omnitrophica bacterium]|nr:bifunctional phosphoserine phosphatase/homoserine phosphotransferase ThrH [Candidatus Omnitrophota bacterium]